MNEESVVRLMIAVSLALYQEGIRKILSSEKDIEIVAETINYLEIVPLIEKVKPDVLFLDKSISRVTNLEILGICKAVREKSPGTKILLFINTTERDVITNFISLGVQGCLTYASSVEQFIQAVRTVNRGESWM